MAVPGRFRWGLLIMNSIYIYLVYSSFQHRIAQAHLRQKKPDTAKSLLVFTDDYSVAGLPVIADYSVTLKFRENGAGSSKKTKGQLAKLCESNKAYRRIEEIISSYSEVQILFPHLEGYISNWLFTKYSKHPGFKFHLLQDGVLSYYEYKGSRKKLFIKKMVSMIFLRRFEIYNGQVTQIHNESIVHHFLFGAPRLTLAPEKAVVLDITPPELRSPQYAHSDNKIIIVGLEPYINIKGFEWYKKMLSTMVSLAQSLGNCIEYRQHPRADGKAELIRSFLNERGVKFIDDPHEDIESVLESWEGSKLPALVGFTSSVLIYSKLAYGSSINCYSVLNSERDLSSHEVYLKKIFQGLGVVVH